MLVVVLELVISGFTQITISTGGIQGTVTDPSGALVIGAKVSLTNVATGQIAAVDTNSAGAYTFAFLKPGDFVVRIEANGFKITRLPLTVKLALGTRRQGSPFWPASGSNFYTGFSASPVQ